MFTSDETGDIARGTAVWDGTAWVGEIFDTFFYAYWTAYSGECEFVVIFDGEEVARSLGCYGAECRDPAGSADAAIGYEEGVLEWFVHEPRALAYITDPDTGCMTYACGSLECTCRCMCVTVVEPYTGVACIAQEICDVTYECDLPRWEGTVECRGVSYFVSIELTRDDYTGECVWIFRVDDVELSPGETGEDGEIIPAYQLPDGTTFRFACKEECMECSDIEVCECDERCDPIIADTITGEDIPTFYCDNPMPTGLSVDLNATPSAGSDTCFTGSGGIEYKTALSGGQNCWEGTIQGTCTDCNNVVRNWSVFLRMCCAGNNQYTVFAIPGSPAVISGGSATTLVTATSCDPFLLEGCIEGQLTAFITACLGPMPPDPGTTYAVCFQIYE